RHGRCRLAVRTSNCASASLSNAADHDDRALPGRRGNRRDRADHGGADARPVGQPIVIENIGGADGSIGVRRTARAQPDGYTICLGLDSTFVHNGAFYSLPYDVLKDFEPISPLATGPVVLVARKTKPAQNLSELIAWLKAHPNQATAGMNTLVF